MSDPNIPIVPNSFTYDQKAFAQAIKACLEILMGQGRNLDDNRALRVSEYRAGIAEVQESLPEPDLGQSMDIPAPPTNLIITKGVWSHHLTWDNPTDEIVSHIEIWVATNSQDRSNAVLRGIVTVTENLRGEKGTFDFSGLDVTADLVYWIRSISYAGNHSIWEPPDDQGGYVVPGNETLDETINNIMDILKGSITEDQLYIDLSSRIDLIDFPATGLIDRIADMDFTISNPATGLIDRMSTVELAIDSMPLFDTNVPYFVDEMVSYSNKIYACIKNTTTPSPLPTDTEYWKAIGSSASLTGAMSANALAINNLDSRVVVVEGEVTSIASNLTLLYSEVGNNRSAVQTEQEARTTADFALASNITTLFSTVEGNTAAIIAEQETRSDANSALASNVETLSATLDGATEAVLLSWTGNKPIKTNSSHGQADEWLFESAFEDGALIQIQVNDGYSGNLKIALNGQVITSNAFQDMDCGEVSDSDSVLNDEPNIDFWVDLSKDKDDYDLGDE